jgi:hypothetical protein
MFIFTNLFRCLNTFFKTGLFLVGFFILFQFCKISNYTSFYYNFVTGLKNSVLLRRRRLPVKLFNYSIYIKHLNPYYN